MATGRCSYPSHHSPSAGPPLGLLAAIALGAVVIGFFHAVVVALVVVCFLAAIAGAVFLLWHSAHAEPYDAAMRDEEQRSAAYSLTATALAARPAGARTAALEAENRELRRQLEAPATVHQHLHLHGLRAVEVAELVARQQERSAIEDSRRS